MSHSKSDAVGGHRGPGIVYDDGFYSHSMRGRRWAKKFNRREARREFKRTTAQALLDYRDEIEAQFQELMEYLEESLADYYSDAIDAELIYGADWQREWDERTIFTDELQPGYYDRMYETDFGEPDPYNLEYRR